MPRTSTQVMNATIRNAGRLKMIGMPATRGACAKASRRLAHDRAQRVDVAAGRAVAASSRARLRRRAVVDAQPRRAREAEPAQQFLEVADHDIATATLPMAYSRIRSQPMIHATSSPSVAYA